MLKSFRVLALLGVVFLAGCAEGVFDSLYVVGTDFDRDARRTWEVEGATEYRHSAGDMILIPPQNSWILKRPIAVKDGRVTYQFENILEAQQEINLDKENRQRELDENRQRELDEERELVEKRAAAKDKRAAERKRRDQVFANWKREHYDTRSIRNPLIIGHGKNGVISFDIGNDDFRGLKAQVTCYDAFDTITVNESYNISKASVTPTRRQPAVHAMIGGQATYNGKYIGGPMHSVFYEIKLQELATEPSTDRCVMKTLEFRQ